MEHKFNIEIAELVGLEASVILNNLYFWVEHNKANNTNFNDGRYWTYNSIKAYEKLFPYLTKHKIINALKTLEDYGFIVTGNYNKSSYDRTKWYSVNEFKHLLKSGNGSDENQTTIPDIKPDTNNNNILLGKINPLDELANNEYYKVAEAFRQLFIKNREEQGVKSHANLEKAKYYDWIDEIRLMIEKDKCTIDQLRDIYDFLNGNTEQAIFWKPNIQSIDKLRSQFDKLIFAMNKDKIKQKAIKKQNTFTA